jgi:hypothetical protein
LDARLTTLLCEKKIIVAKSKEVKTGSNLSESSKEGYGSKTAVLPEVVMMWIWYQHDGWTAHNTLITHSVYSILLSFNWSWLAKNCSFS